MNWFEMRGVMRGWRFDRKGDRERGKGEEEEEEEDFIQNRRRQNSMPRRGLQS